jgi:hypothetical protein
VLTVVACAVTQTLICALAGSPCAALLRAASTVFAKIRRHVLVFIFGSHLGQHKVDVYPCSDENCQWQDVVRPGYPIAAPQDELPADCKDAC